jgi:hypothetical protein
MGGAMGIGSDRDFGSSFGGGGGHEVTPVSADDVARVVTRAWAERGSRLRLTSGQRLAILNRGLRPSRAAGG